MINGAECLKWRPSLQVELYVNSHRYRCAYRDTDIPVHTDVCLTASKGLPDNSVTFNYFHFTDGETEARPDEVSCARRTSRFVSQKLLTRERRGEGTEKLDTNYSPYMDICLACLHTV